MNSSSSNRVVQTTRTAELAKLRAERDALKRLADAIRQDRENYVSGPASRAALAEYEAVKR